MNEVSTLKTNAILKQLAENTRNYYEIEKEIAIMKDKLAESENEIVTILGTNADLMQQVTDLNLVDLDSLNNEIAILAKKKSKLNFWAIKSSIELNSFIKQRKNELNIATHKNNVIAKIQENINKSERAKRLQDEILDANQMKQEELDRVAALIKEQLDYFSDISEDSLVFSVIEMGVDMIYLPTIILRKVVSKNVPDCLKEMPVQKQVKLLYPYDAHIHFGGREWNVLEVYSDKALLLLRGSYASPQYYRKKYGWEEKAPKGNAFDRCEAMALTWENSEAREILNNDFIHSLQLKDEEKILPGKNGDMVFCLSERDVELYLDVSQRTIGSPWWLSDTKYFKGYADCDIAPKLEVAYVSSGGAIKYNPHNYVQAEESYTWTHDDMRFRPALWVELPKDSLDDEWKENVYNNCLGQWTSKSSGDSYNISDIELTPDVVKRISDAASAKVNGTPSKELPDFVVTPRIDVSDV